MKKLIVATALSFIATTTFAGSYSSAYFKTSRCENSAKMAQTAYKNYVVDKEQYMTLDRMLEIAKRDVNKDIMINAIINAHSEYDAYMQAWAKCMDEK